MKLFKSTLEDKITEYRIGNHPSATQFFLDLQSDIKKDMKGRDDLDMAIAMEKIFLFIYESQSVQWSHFLVLDAMSAQNAIQAKRLGYILSGYFFSPNEASLMMATNNLTKALFFFKVEPNEFSHGFSESRSSKGATSPPKSSLLF